MVSKFILLGASFALTVGGAVVEISRADKITAGEGNKKSLKFESIEDIKKVADAIPDASMYKLLSSTDEEAKKGFTLSEDFHSLTLNNHIQRKYEYSKDESKINTEVLSYIEPAYEGKLYNETEFDQNHTNWMNYPYENSYKEKWMSYEVTETYNNDITSYYTEKGLMLNFKINHTLTYDDVYSLYNYSYFAGADNDLINRTKRLDERYKNRSELETILEGAIYITDGTAYLKYDKNENNYSYQDVGIDYDNDIHGYKKTDKEFDEIFYTHFPEARPSEQKQIKDAMEKSIKKYYGKFFDLRFTADTESMEEMMKKIPQTEEEIAKLSDKEIKNMMGDMAMAMITPVLMTLCDTTVNEMISVGDVPMNQFKLNLDFYSEIDDENNLIHTKKEGSKYSLEGKDLNEFFINYNDSSNFMPKSIYDAKNQENILRRAEQKIRDEHNTVINDIKNSNDEEAKNALESYEAQMMILNQQSGTEQQKNELERAFNEVLVSFVLRHYDLTLNPQDRDGKAILTLLDPTAPTFYTDYISLHYTDAAKVSHQATFKDRFTIKDVDNTVINAPNKIRLNVYDVYKGAMDEYASAQYDAYKKSVEGK